MKTFVILSAVAISFPVAAQYSPNSYPPAQQKSSPSQQQRLRGDTPPSQPQPSAQSADSRALDAAVRASLARKDFGHAKSLAVTAQHWQWIEEAQNPKRSSSEGRTYGDFRAEMANSQRCADARRSHEIEAGAFKKNYAAIEAKRASMAAACGMPY